MNDKPTLPTKDLRSPLAKARDAYLETTDCDPSTLGSSNPKYYLRNRLALAFEAGAAAARKERP